MVCVCVAGDMCGVSYENEKKMKRKMKIHFNSAAAAQIGFIHNLQTLAKVRSWVDAMLMICMMFCVMMCDV